MQVGMRPKSIQSLILLILGNSAAVKNTGLNFIYISVFFLTFIHISLD